MSAEAKGGFKLFTGRLSRKVVFWVFTSVVAIEAILLIPSLLRREKELISEIHEVSASKVAVIKQVIQPQMYNEEFLKEVKKFQDSDPINLIGKLQHKIIGGALYKSDGTLVGTIGEEPEVLFDDVNSKSVRDFRNKKGDRYEAVWTPEMMPGGFTLILRHDTSSVKPELKDFILRIAGLVLIISVVVTAGTWIALDPIAITPIIRLRNDLIGAGEAICKDAEPPDFYSATVQRQDELGDVISAFNQMFAQITEAIRDRKQAEAALQGSLNKVEEYSQKLNEELDKGREMQTNFLPVPVIEKPVQVMQKPGWEIAAFFKPARQVAGDFYDSFEIDEYVGLVIADVCDKGVGAALFMGLFRSLIRIFSHQIRLKGNASGILEANSPADGWIGESKSINLAHMNALQAVKVTNNYIAENHGELGMFATLFFGVLDPATGLLTYINGGHEDLLIVNPNGGVKQRLKSTGPAVGMLPDLKFKVQQTRLEPGETLLGYTDGVPEARAAGGEFFTTKGLLSMLEQPVPSVTTLLEQISEAVLEHTGAADQFDDITLLAVRRIPH
ncbi:MAG: serine/threonine-protein phosphatase [Hormoscilla sp. GM7CHS1pb]|nr:serine/threonine-protein phosphatase [Hormoscilla sp. GM7CHS1pb]